MWQSSPQPDTYQTHIGKWSLVVEKIKSKIPNKRRYWYARFDKKTVGARRGCSQPFKTAAEAQAAAIKFAKQELNKALKDLETIENGE